MPDTSHRHPHTISRRISLGSYAKLAFLLLCSTIGCYLPSAIVPIGRPSGGALPPRAESLPTLVITPAEGNLHVNPPAGESRPETPVWQPPTAPQGWKYIVLHHTATDSGSVESIDRTHRERTDADGNSWRGIGYHFVIGNGDGMADGEVQPTFRWMEQSAGAHAGHLEYNTYGIGICLVGNFEEHPPTPAQLVAVKQLVAELKAEFGIDSSAVLRHGDLKATECPGRLFPHDEIAMARLAEWR